MKFSGLVAGGGWPPPFLFLFLFQCCEIVSLGSPGQCGTRNPPASLPRAGTTGMCRVLAFYHSLFTCFCFTFYSFIWCVCVCARAHESIHSSAHVECVEVRARLEGCGSLLPTTWILGVELRSRVLVASAFIHGAISLALQFTF